MNASCSTNVDQGESLRIAIPDQHHWNVSYYHQQASADSLISGYLDESVVKEEDSPLEFSERSHTRHIDHSRTSACKRQYDFKESENGIPQLSSIVRLPPRKRPNYDSPSNSLSNSSSDAQSPPELVGGGNTFTNHAFQMGDADYSGASLEESLDVLDHDLSSESHHFRRVDPNIRLQQPFPPDRSASHSLRRTFSERIPGQRFNQHESLQVTTSGTASMASSDQRPLAFQTWSQIPCGTLLEVLGSSDRPQEQQQRQLATRPAELSCSVQADKGFQFSGREGVWISQKKNHFQITCFAGVSGDQWAVPVASASDEAGIQHHQQESCTVHMVHSFQLSLIAVRAESPLESPPIVLEQAEANRTRRQFITQPLHLPGRGVRLRAVAGRLHFTSATLNNQRRRGELHPDQRFFRLVVGLDAVLESGLVVPLCRQISGCVIVRASNPGQFEASATGATIAADATAESTTGDAQAQPTDGWRFQSPGVATFAGRIGVNTTTPGEALTVNGNLQLQGNLLQPSDARIKAIEDELRPADQLANISRLRIYNYRRLGAGQGVGASGSHDTGVIAQEVAGVLPDAVRKSSTQLVPSTGEPLLLVNKDRIYMENVGAVKQLGELTSSLEKRIGELERMRSKLCRLRDSLRVPGSQQQQQQQQQLVGSEAADAATEAGEHVTRNKDVDPADGPKSHGKPSRRSSTTRCIKISTLAIAFLALVSCSFCAAAVILLTGRLTGPAAPTAPMEATNAVSMTSLAKELTTSSIATTKRSTTTTTATTYSPSTNFPLLTTSRQPNDGIIRPKSCDGTSCQPVACCHSTLSKLLSAKEHHRAKKIEAADVAVWNLSTARLASANVGEWGLTVGNNVRCDAIGDSSRLSLQFNGSNCRGSNVTLKLMLDETFPAEADLHLRLKTNLTCDYCQPAKVHGRCVRQSDGKVQEGGCVPVAGWGCDCNLGNAAAHLQHLATLRLNPPGLTNPTCQMDRGALGQTFIELRILIERQTYGCSGG